MQVWKPKFQSVPNTNLLYGPKSIWIRLEKLQDNKFGHYNYLVWNDMRVNNVLSFLDELFL